MTEVDYIVTFGAIGIVATANATLLKVMWSSFCKHKETVQYKDNCTEIVKSAEKDRAAARELFDTKLGNIENKIDGLIGEVRKMNDKTT